MINRDKPARVIHSLNIVTFLIGLLVFLSVGSYLDPLVPSVFLVLFAGAIACEYRKRFLPRIVLTASSVIILAIYVFRLRSADLAPLTTETLLLLLGIKLLEKKQFRDYVQTYLISVFLLAGAALLGISITFLCYVLVLVFLFNIAMILVTYFRDDPNIVLPARTVEKILLKGSLIPVCAIPLGILIFVITPRTPYPLLDFLNQSSHTVTGFSDHVRLGKVSEIQQDNRPVFRAAMERVPEGTLYWRGIVLEHFDGSTWKSLPKKFLPERPAKIVRPSAKIRQEIYLEPYGDVYLFGLDRPSIVTFRGVREYGDGTFATSEPIGRKVRYGVSSYTQGSADNGEMETNAYLQVPPGFSTAVKGLARQLKARDQETTLNAISRFLNSGSFSYSLQHLPVAQKPLDEFLFNLKRGNCEYFASAFAVMARVNGIPSRMVAGYLGGLYSDVGKYYLVSQKQAHVWVEAYVPGKGWVRYDPTPPQVGAGEETSGFFSRTRLLFDMINYYWVAFVVSYDVQKQYTLFFRATNAVEETGSTLAQLPLSWIAVTAAALVITIFSAIAIRDHALKSDPERLVKAFCTRLQKHGYVRKTSQGLEEFVQTIGNEQIRKQAGEFVTRFEEIYYRDRTFTKEEIQALRRGIAQLGSGEINAAGADRAQTS
jgi:protein-glutamine gamma-glutamyltransferase